MYTAFISDLHLCEHDSLTYERFVQFIAFARTQVSTLYILGDLFDAWIGDDDDHRFSRNIQLKLSELSQAGCSIYLIRGNRDFLLGHAFAETIGAKLLKDVSLVEIDGLRLLLLHGDQLCTDDPNYQKARNALRCPKRIQRFLAMPLWIRRLLAACARWISRHASARKPASIMDANQEAIGRYLVEYQADCLIHGHTHKPRDERRGDQKRRIVLGAWEQEPQIALLKEGKLWLSANWPELVVNN